MPAERLVVRSIRHFNRTLRRIRYEVLTRLEPRITSLRPIPKFKIPEMSDILILSMKYVFPYFLWLIPEAPPMKFPAEKLPRRRRITDVLAVEDPSILGVNQLREILTENAIAYDDCEDKTELIKKFKALQSAIKRINKLRKILSSCQYRKLSAPSPEKNRLTLRDEKDRIRKAERAKARMNHRNIASLNQTSSSRRRQQPRITAQMHQSSGRSIMAKPKLRHLANIEVKVVQQCSSRGEQEENHANAFRVMTPLLPSSLESGSFMAKSLEANTIIEMSNEDSSRSATQNFRSFVTSLLPSCIKSPLQFFTNLPEWNGSSEMPEGGISSDTPIKRTSSETLQEESRDNWIQPESSECCHFWLERIRSGQLFDENNNVTSVHMNQLLNHVFVHQGCIALSEMKEILDKLPGKIVPQGPSDDSLCNICMASPTDCVLLECGHMVSCMECGSKLVICPICRKEVKRVVRTYRS